MCWLNISNNVKPHCSRKATDKSFTSHKTTGKFIVLYIQIFTSFQRRWDNILNQTAYSRAYKIWGLKNIIFLVRSHSITSYRIIFGGNTPNSIKVFRMQKKKVIRIISKSKKMDSCSELFKTMEILPLYSQYMFSLLMYVVNACGAYGWGEGGV